MGGFMGGGMGLPGAAAAAGAAAAGAWGGGVAGRPGWSRAMSPAQIQAAAPKVARQYQHDDQRALAALCAPAPAAAEEGDAPGAGGEATAESMLAAVRRERRRDPSEVMGARVYDAVAAREGWAQNGEVRELFKAAWTQVRAEPVAGGLPRCWAGGGGLLHPVAEEGAEWGQVSALFHRTLTGGHGVAAGALGYMARARQQEQVCVCEVVRVQNEAVYKEYHARNHQGPDGPRRELLMFHGARGGQHAEDSIVQNGFRVDKCVSGGANFGTWLAYVAAYSDGGFAFNDAAGLRHLFLCITTETDVRLDDGQVMRVVGEACAYPLYIIKYQRAADGITPRAMIDAVTDHLGKRGEGWGAENALISVDHVCRNATATEFSARFTYTTAGSDERKTDFRSFSAAPLPIRGRPKYAVTGMGGEGSGFTGAQRPPTRDEVRDLHQRGKLGSLGVVRLRAFLASVGKPAAGNKKRLVELAAAACAAAP